MTDMSHLNALELSLSHESARIGALQSSLPFGKYSDKILRAEISWREHNCRMIEKEIAAEYKFLGISAPSTLDDISDDELLAMLA